MNPVIHQVGERRINHAVALERQASRERPTDDVHVKVTLALSDMADVLVAVIDHIEGHWREGGLQALTNLLLHRYAHAGSALRNGLICTSAYTPAAT